MQPVPKTAKVIGYRANGFFREYIMSRPVEETIFFPVEVSALENQQGHGHGCLTTEGIGQHKHREHLGLRPDPVPEFGLLTATVFDSV